MSIFADATQDIDPWLRELQVPDDFNIGIMAKESEEGFDAFTEVMDLSRNHP